MNQYNSRTGHFRARNVYEATLSPPADLTLAIASFKPQVLNRVSGEVAGNLSVNSNFCIKRIGVFSNFADGLVFKNAWEGLDVKIHVGAYVQSGLSGTSTFALNSKAITGAGTQYATELVSGDIIKNAGTYMIVDTITDADDMTVTDYPTRSGAGMILYKIGDVTGQQVQYQQFIRELNYMHDCEFFFSPAVYATLAATDVVITAVVNSSALAPTNHDCTFLTKGISADFDEDKVYFDVGADIEITPA